MAVTHYMSKISTVVQEWYLLVRNFQRRLEKQTNYISKNQEQKKEVKLHGKTDAIFYIQSRFEYLPV